MPSKTPIETAWGYYCRGVLPAAASSVQITECRRAFWAGAGAVFFEVMRAGMDPNISDEQGEELLAAIQTELAEFGLRAKEGKE